MITRTHLTIAAPAALGVVAVVAATVVLLPDDAMDRLLLARSTGSAVDALEDDQARELAPEKFEHPPAPPYEGPTSIYIEEGFDPDISDLDMAGGPSASPVDAGLPSRLSGQQIQRVFRDHQSQLLSCYGAALARDTSLAGSVEFDFAVHPSGQVAMVKVADSSLRSREAEDCFVDKARHWPFPETSQDLPARFQIAMAFQY